MRIPCTHVLLGGHMLRCTVQSAGLHNRTVSYMVCVLCGY